ncbi:MAG: phosphatase PAP2 family protein [Actinobacteria bacterium]|nr:phosphatase PAP2 family protein [Actinomycetota bacterium]
MSLWFAVEADGPVVRADRRILGWVLDHRSAALTAAMRGVTVLGDVRVIVLVGAVAVAWLVASHRRDLAVVLVVSSTGTWLLVNAVKRLVERPRPPQAVRLVAAGGWSFPSGHAGQAAAMYLAVGLLGWLVLRSRSARWTALVTAVLLAGAVGISRVYLGVHWSSDVVAGWSLGSAWFLVLLGVAGYTSRARRAAANL